MSTRNPFTSISNLSFIRNANNFLDSRPSSRSCSGSKAYFQYQGSYLGDHYLLDWEVRKKQEELSRKIMGVQALRYRAESTVQPQCDNLQSKVEYYNLEKVPQKKPVQQRQRPSEIGSLKCSTRDMFGSEYFNNRFEQQEDNDNTEYPEPGRLQLKKKSTKTFSRFKKGKEFSKLEQSKESEEESRPRALSKESCFSKYSSKDPQTLFVKSKNKLFFLYRNPYEDQE